MPPANRAGRLKRLARRLAGPALGPIDGRVADINRHVDDTRDAGTARSDEVRARLERLEAAVNAHAAAAQVGIETSTARLEARINELSERLERLRVDVGAHADAAREQAMYTGVDLRRLEEAVRAALPSTE